jgi:transposase-like protein
MIHAAVFDNKCPDCGGDFVMEEKYTNSGQDIREYRCEKCRKSVTVDHGTALWKILSDARNQSRDDKK